MDADYPTKGVNMPRRSTIDVLRWLEAWLEACAKNGRKPPHDLSPWLPWSMSEDRKRAFMMPG